ncbi:uncharacterized protein LTR77_008018 [Saxophila tyrrhenica]|uniref:Uncharacterized protein n=1 Tax=Saxophila tyrrhenica TaxID=1690608 RepID=A0AAV9P1J1_9PEZI|nr:hypothetical protein LTR77_008018 [Saxophila tyrrhenica]
MAREKRDSGPHGHSSRETKVGVHPAPHTEPCSTPHRVVTFCEPHPDDIIFSHARHLLVVHNKQSFDHFTDPLKVEALVNLPTATLWRESAIEALALTFDKSVIPVPFKLVRNRVSASFTLKCDVKGGWRSFQEWLRELKSPPSRHLSGKKAIRIQQQWSKKNGQPFRVMDLPAEVRMLIFEQAVGVEHFPIMELLHPRSGSSYYGEGAQNSTDDEPRVGTRLRRIDPPNVNLISSCKQILQEIGPFMRHGTTKVFQTLTDLERYTLHNRFPEFGGVQTLRHITIDLTNYDLAEYLAYVDDDTRTMQKAVNLDMAPLLGRLPNLKSVCIHFRSAVSPPYQESSDPLSP